MEGYLGEIIVDKKDTIYVDYTQKDWALFRICQYGGIDGDHHKDWVLDQVVRILNGTQIIISLASWKNGQTEYRFNLDEPTELYHDWVKEAKSGEDGPDTYSYDVGTPP